MTRHREECEALRTRAPKTVAELLVRHGARFDRELREQYLVDAFDLCPGDAWFTPSALLALRWSRHAQYTDEGCQEYFDAGRRYSDNPEVLDEICRHHDRFGEAAFVRAIEVYQSLFRARRRELFDRWPASPGDMREKQEAMIADYGAGVLHGATGSTIGIGPW